MKKERKTYQGFMSIAEKYSKNKKYDDALNIYRQLYQKGYRTQKLLKEAEMLLPA